MSKYAIQPLSATTWNAFVQLAEKHNGVWGGCWCTWFHPPRAEKDSETRRDYKWRLIREGIAHAALVYDGTLPSVGANSAPRSSFPASTT